MKILMYAGIKPGENPSIEDLLTKKYDVGGNIGNLLFINAVGESIDPNGKNTVEITHYRANPSDAQKINSYFDRFILPLADAFRDDNIVQLNRMTALIKKLTIPCVVVGVGLRSKYGSDPGEPHPFDKAVKDFVGAVLEKSSCLGLRGERTAEYLRRLGFREERDFTPIGCPSMCMLGLDSKVKDLKLTSDSRIALNGNDLAPENVNRVFRRAIREYKDAYIVQQRESEIADLYLGKYARGETFRVQGSLYGKELYGRMYKEGRIKCFPNIYRWTEFLSSADLCFNSRFHGTVAGLMAGTPSLVISIDSRMQEMVEYHAIPSIPAKDVMETDDIEDILSHVDINSFMKVAEKNTRHYFNFLERNQLPHVALDHVPSYKFTGGGYTSCWKDPEKPLLELSKAEQISRVASFYTKKYGNKVAHKLGRRL